MAQVRDGRYIGCHLVACFCPTVSELFWCSVKIRIPRVEGWVKTHLVAKSVSCKDDEMPSFIGESIAQRTCVGRIDRTFILQMLNVTRLEVDITGSLLSILVDKGWYAILIQSLEIHGEQRAIWITLKRKARTCNHLDKVTTIL